jgi:hypothetical protein
MLELNLISGCPVKGTHFSSLSSEIGPSSVASGSHFLYAAGNALDSPYQTSTLVFQFRSSRRFYDSRTPLENHGAKKNNSCLNLLRS